ncbi:DnaB-like helicase C-terminal domain-containing protein [Amycolatopsis sp. NPDC006131]|uniref:DnaB-like helicase C-terminal domain-containing protein n=1 Tax=Amycolatopsis sp. NPDC006131 TaxID=3156731 RepID=UPI00339E5320
MDNGDHFEVPALARKMLGGYAGEPEIPDPAGVEPSSAWVSELVDPWRTRMHTRENTIPTPWDDFNHEFSGGGLLPKRICTIAAPTGFGKSVAGIQVATHAAENGYPAVIFSAEMDKLEVFDRIVARKARIPLTAIENRDLQDFNWRRYESTLEWFNEQPLLIDDTAPMSIEYVASALRHHVKHNGVKLAVIDYLQLLDSRFKAQSREQQVAYLSRQVKALVMELGITIVQLAQINRDGNVRESAQIENDSNVLIVMKKPDEVEGPSLYVDMAVVKNRNGRKGTFRLIFNGNYGDLERNDPKGFDQ